MITAGSIDCGAYHRETNPPTHTGVSFELAGQHCKEYSMDYRHPELIPSGSVLV